MTLEEIQEKHARGEYGKTDWKRVDSLTDEEIEEAIKNDPDAAPLVDRSFWDDAKVFLPPKKVEVHMWMDEDIVNYFKKKGKGYQTRINTILRTYVEAHPQK